MWQGSAPGCSGGVRECVAGRSAPVIMSSGLPGSRRKRPTVNTQALPHLVMILCSSSTSPLSPPPMLTATCVAKAQASTQALTHRIGDPGPRCPTRAPSYLTGAHAICDCIPAQPRAAPPSPHKRAWLTYFVPPVVGMFRTSAARPTPVAHLGANPTSGRGKLKCGYLRLHYQPACPHSVSMQKIMLSLDPQS